MVKRKDYDYERLNQCGLMLRYCVLGGSCLMGIFGIVVMGLSIFVFLYGLNFTSTVMGTSLVADAASVLIASGAIVLISSLAGCYGVVYNSRPTLLTYSIVLTIAFVLAVVSGVLAIVFRTWMIDQIRTHMRNTLQTQYGVGGEANQQVTANWDLAQQKWYCCAVENNSWGIYRSSAWYGNQSGIPEYDKPWVPQTCCVKDQYGKYVNLMKCQSYNNGPPGIQSGQPNEALFYQGCYQAGTTILYQVAASIAGVSISFSLLLAVLIVFSVWLSLLV